MIIHSGNNINHRETYTVYSGEVRDMRCSFVNRLTTEAVSASGTANWYTWYFPAGLGAVSSATASGGSGIEARFSATAAPTTLRVSARVLTTSGQYLLEQFDVKVITGA